LFEGALIVRTRIIALVSVVVALLLTKTVCQAEGLSDPPEGFRTLFNGKDFSGWYGLGNFDPRKLKSMSDEERAAKKIKDMELLLKHWSVQDGVIVNDGKGPYLTTEEEFGDIELLIEYKTVAKADSGVYLRGTPQIQIWDYTEEGGKWNIGADKGSGGLWNNSPGAAGKDPLVLADKPFGQWNALRIRQIGARTTVYLNGKLVVDNAIMENYWDRQSPLFPTGQIQLQTHGGEIQWRNIFLREIEAEEANQVLKSINAEGFKSIFNGRDFAGWQGAVDNYEVSRDNVIRCKKGKGGTLYTKDSYGDFVVRLEFRLPPAGNNGLAIRYPGQGNPAYHGMCELQVLDAEHPKYAGWLDPRQYHASAYGMIPAKPGYLRPLGQWNFQEVTVQGSRVKVELNGTVVLDGDLSQVTEYMGDQAHPGKDLKAGHFGFAGHNDPVEFREIFIKKL
jgi:hypothetical protein